LACSRVPSLSANFADIVVAAHLDRPPCGAPTSLEAPTRP
jgi:hypothetical protein